MSRYKFSTYIFDSQLAQIIVGDEIISLEPQQATLLHFLIEHRDAIVSRDDIAEKVWQGLVVEDNTISKAITRVRKALNDNAKSPLYIKTVPKKGYQFIAPIDLIDAVPNTRTERPNNSFVMLGIVFSLFLLFLLIAVSIFFEPVADKVEKIPSALTYRQGFDSNAHLSPDGNHLLFLGKEKEGGYSIFVKGLKDASIRKLSTVGSPLVYPKWLSSNKFVFSRLDQNDQCQIVISAIEAPTNVNELTSCLSEVPVEVQVNPVTNNVYWLDDSGSWKLDLNDASRQRLLFGTQNFKYQQVSSNGAYWAGLISQNNESEIFVYDIASKLEVGKVHIPYEINQFRWDYEDNAIYHLSEHPAHQLLKRSLSGNRELITQASFGTISQISELASTKTIEFVISTVDLDIATAFESSELNELMMEVNSAFPDYHPAVSPDHKKLAFASKRSGSAQVWLKSNVGEFKQLTDFKRASYIYDVIWSPDNQHILVNKNQTIHVIDTLSLKTSVLPFDGTNKSHLQWLDAAHIAFVDTSTQSLFSYQIDSHDLQLLKSNVNRAIYAGNDWYVQEVGEDNVKLFNRKLEFSHLVYDSLAKRQWLINDTKLYIIDERKMQLLSVGENHVESLVLDNLPNTLSLSGVGNGQFIYHKVNRSEANVYQLHLE